MLKRLLSQSTIYGLTTLASRGSLVVLLLILPFIVSPGDYGVLAMLAVLAALVNVVVPLEITQAMVRFYTSAEGETKNLYVSSAWWMTLAALSAFLLISQIAAAPLSKWILGTDSYVSAFRLGLVVISLTSLFYFLQSQFRFEFRTKEYVAASLLFSILTLVLSLGFGVLWSEPLHGILTGQVAGAAGAVAFAAWRLRRTIAGSLDLRRLKEMLQVSLPIVPASLALLLSLYASRFILNDLEGLQAVGLFSFASQIAGIAGLALVGVQSAVTPLIMAHHEDPGTPALLGRTFEMFSGLALGGCLALGLFSPELIHSFGSPDYREAGPLVLPLALSVVAGGMYFFLPGFIIGKKTGRQMWVSLASASTSIGLNYLLIGTYGLDGAVVATLLGSLVFVGLWFLLSQPLYPVPIRWGAIFIALAVTMVAGTALTRLDYPDLATAILVKLGAAAAIGAIILMTGLIPVRQGLRAAATLLARVRHSGADSTAESPRT